MAEVFEDFVATALREAWAACRGETRPQYPASFDEEGGVRMKVDVVHVVNGMPRIVAAAKYKLESGSDRYPNADHYQMLAYCTALRVPVGWLVYARGSPGSVTRHVRHTEIEIVEHPLQLEVSPAALLLQIADLATAAWHRSREKPALL